MQKIDKLIPGKWGILYDEEHFDAAGDCFCGVISNLEYGKCLFFTVSKENEDDEVETMRVYNSVTFDESTEEVRFPWTNENEELLLNCLNYACGDNYSGDGSPIRTLFLDEESNARLEAECGVDNTVDACAVCALLDGSRSIKKAHYCLERNALGLTVKKGTLWLAFGIDCPNAVVSLSCDLGYWLCKLTDEYGKCVGRVGGMFDGNDSIHPELDSFARDGYRLMNSEPAFLSRILAVCDQVGWTPYSLIITTV